MKLLCIFLLVSGSLFAQVTDEDAITAELGFDLAETISKVTDVTPSERKYLFDGLLNYLDKTSSGDDVVLQRHVAANAKSPNPALSGSTIFPYSTVDPAIVPFDNYFAGGEPKYNPSFQRSAAAVHLVDLTTAQPAAPPDPQLIFLDGLGNSLIAVDLTTLTVVSQVVVPSTVGPFGIRPNAPGSSNEVWVANGGSEIEVSVVNLSTQTLVTSILTPSIPQSTFPVPVGIVFTNDGATAFEAFKYDSPDSAGNNGALVVFDAAGRTVTSTMLLKFTPTALLMAPDGSTAYLLSNTGTITYYDVLSGTADLTVSTYPPGSDAGYPGAGSAVFIHPDGTRLFWNVGVYLTVFDLTMRTVTNQFNSGLPTTVGRTFSLSQDGGRAYFSDQLGDVAILQTYDGTVLTTYNTGAATSVFGGPPVAP
jgi:hypothetical protein